MPFIVEEPEYVANEERDWVWKNWIPANQITIIAGDSAVGKSRTLASVLWCVVRNEPFPDGSFPDLAPPHILLINTESDRLEVQDTYISQGWDAQDLTHLHILRNVQTTAGTEPFDIDKPHHISELAAIRKKYKEVIIILDPFIEFHNRNSISDTQIRGLIMKVQALARAWKATIILMAHWNKNEKQSYGARLAGSHQLTAGVRAMINLFKEKTESRTFHQHKNSNGPEQPDLYYKISQPDGAVVWMNQPEISADSKLGIAQAWLLEYLQEHKETTIAEAVAASNLAESTLKRARHNLDAHIFTTWKFPVGGHKQIAYWELRTEDNLWGIGKLSTKAPGV